MEKLIVYQGSTGTIVVHENDEAEFVARFFGEDGIDGDEWTRTELSGPVEIDTSRPSIAEAYEVYTDL
jgi:hypothetical protein